MVPDEPRHSASPFYAMGQLQRAVESLAAAPGGADRARMEAKVARWRRVVAGMADGTLQVGSRTPVAGTPAWVTLEVAHGGFATGRFLAETPLNEDDRAVLEELPGGTPGVTDRERVNLWYLSDAGLDQLRRALATGAYRVEVPEQAALLVATWLLDHGRYEAALDLVSELRPWMARLAFTPSFTTVPQPFGAAVRVQTADAAAAALWERRPRAQIAVMAETLRVWHPLFDRLVVLWCDTVEGEPPRLVTGAPGEPTVAGGWPCRRWPADWAERRRAWLADYDVAVREHRLARQHRSPKSNFARLRQALERCETGSSTLTARDVGWIRRALANTITRHGAPGSRQRAELRSAQAAVAGQPAHADLARVLAGRLARFPGGSGIPDIESIAGAVGPGESPTVPQGQQIPGYLIAKAARALEAPAGELIQRGIISSADVLAAVLPQITAQVLAAGFDDPGLRTLHQQAYAAFRRRRSLLLLNLDHQVRFAELPWITAIEPFRTSGASAAHAARQTLEQVTLLALTGFPHAIVPNPLIAEMNALAAQAGLDLPLVEEVAADIFTGTFTSKWRLAAATASAALEGTLYARYYDLPGPRTWAPPRGKIAAPVTRRQGKETAEDFAALCATRAARAREAGARVSYVSANGMILEQAQILTTQNLAVLIDALGLRGQITPLAPQLADHAFAWIARRLRQQSPSRYADLQAVKNSAYAWRQAICYLSLCDPAVQNQALDRLRSHLRAAGPELESRLTPAADGLAHAITGGRFDDSGATPAPASGRQFLGWTTGTHWALNPGQPPAPRVNPAVT